MSANKVREVSTWVAGGFVSVLLLLAATPVTSLF